LRIQSRQTSEWRADPKYKPKPKPEKKNHWGSKLLANLRARGKPKKVSPGQKSLWNEWDKPTEEIHKVAEKFVQANGFGGGSDLRGFENLGGLGGAR